MSKARKLKARKGDTLCGIAIAHGFADCKPLRDEPKNKDLLKRPLRAGDAVTVPVIKKKDEDKADKKRHKWKRPGIPQPQIRFVHGSKSLPYRSDETLRYLNISNFIANMAGDDGLKPFSNAFGFDEDAHADPDTFKIEVVDPSAAGGPVTVELEALKPGAKKGQFEPIGNPRADMRKVKIACEAVEPENKVRMRSRYLRLVTDEWDFKELSGDPPRGDGTAQALLTTDTADGNDGDADKLEILDQHVRATHTMTCCKAADPDKYKVETRVQIGPRRRRVRVAFHLFRQTPGSASLVASVKEREVRYRVRRWFRRIFAQAELSPVFVSDPGIEILDPPPANMITIAPFDGARSSGRTSAGAVSKITLRSRADGVNTDWTVNLAPGMSPAQVASQIKANLPEGHKARAYTNAVCIGRVRGSADLIISRADGKRNLILIASTDDTSLRGKIEIANPNVRRLGNPAGFNETPEGESGARRLLRACKTADDRLDFLVVERFDNMSTGAYAMMPTREYPHQYRPKAPCRLSVLVGARSNGARMDISDSFYSVLAHEAGHALCDVFHPKGNPSADPHWRTDWMHNFESSGDLPEIGKRKRIEDSPLFVEFETPKSTSPWWEYKKIRPVARLRRFGSRCIARW